MKNVKEVKLGEETVKVPTTVEEVIVPTRAKKVVLVAVYHLDGKFYKAFGSVEEASADTKIGIGTIKYCLSPKNDKKHARKFQFHPIK